MAETAAVVSCFRLPAQSAKPKVFAQAGAVPRAPTAQPPTGYSQPMPSPSLSRCGP